jgi:hypothetical protein
MTPKSPFRSCWHAGGSIERRSGSLTRRRAVELVQFHLSEAEARQQAGDRAGATYCLCAAIDLVAALCEASTWRHASGARRVSCVARKLT